MPEVRYEWELSRVASRAEAAYRSLCGHSPKMVTAAFDHVDFMGPVRVRVLPDIVAPIPICGACKAAQYRALVRQMDEMEACH